jgi:hypothetical protein
MILYACLRNLKKIGLSLLFLVFFSFVNAQNSTQPNFSKVGVYAGIEVGSKGVKMSIVELGKNAKKDGAFKVIKDTSVNTDFISFTQPTFTATLNALFGLYNVAIKEYQLPSNKVFTVVSSGVKSQTEKEEQHNWIKILADSFKLRIHDPSREIAAIDVLEEAKLSHLGIIPENRRYTTFLIDIGSGNTKGGYFPNGNTKDFKLLNLAWGTKSTANETEKRCYEDQTFANYSKQLKRVIAGAIDVDVTYAINISGAYAMSDYVAVSGGIGWSIANLLYPELLTSSVVPVTYDDVLKFNEQLSKSVTAYNTDAIGKMLDKANPNRISILNEVNRIHKAFAQRSLLAGSSLLLKIMRQFAGVYEKKQFFLVKNGQVGWISAYVDAHIKNDMVNK